MDKGIIISLDTKEADAIVTAWYMKWLAENEGVIQSEFGSDLEELADSHCCDFIEVEIDNEKW